MKSVVVVHGCFSFFFGIFQECDSFFLVELKK